MTQPPAREKKKKRLYFCFKLSPPPRSLFGSPSLVVDHLASNGLLQSLAVFLPESGLGSSGATVCAGTDATPAAAAAALSREDVLQALPIPADSALFKRVITRAEELGGIEAGPVGYNGGATAAATAPAPRVARGGATAVVVNASTAVSAARGGGGGFTPQQRRVCGLLEALVGEVAVRSGAVSVDSNTQTEEAGRSHKENLGEGVYVHAGNGGGGAAAGRAGA